MRGQNGLLSTAPTARTTDIDRKTVRGLRTDSAGRPSSLLLTLTPTNRKATTMLIDELPTSDVWTVSDWRQVFPGGGSAYSGANWAPLGGKAPDITPDRIARVHGWQASGGDYAEVNFACVVELTDGTWAACMAWADTSGWGCQDGVEWRVAQDLPSIVSYGLDREGRTRLALTSGGAA